MGASPKAVSHLIPTPAEYSTRHVLLFVCLFMANTMDLTQKSKMTPSSSIPQGHCAPRPEVLSPCSQFFSSWHSTPLFYSTISCSAKTFDLDFVLFLFWLQRCSQYEGANTTCFILYLVHTRFALPVIVFLKMCFLSSVFPSAVTRLPIWLSYSLVPRPCDRGRVFQTALGFLKLSSIC